MAEAKIVLASHNKGKLKELREILRGHIDGLDVDTQVVDAASVNAPDVPETGVTFAENSLLKARAVARATGLIAIADDSGLSVNVLGGAPGIFSARWAGRLTAGQGPVSNTAEAFDTHSLFNRINE